MNHDTDARQTDDQPTGNQPTDSQSTGNQPGDSQPTGNQPGDDKPTPRVLQDEELDTLLREHQFGVLATVKRSGHPHQSTVVYRWDSEERVIRVSTTKDRLKVRHIRRDPHVALHVYGPDVWSFAVVEGDATVVPDPEGETDDRVTIEIRAARLYGTSLDFPAPQSATSSPSH